MVLLLNGSQVYTIKFISYKRVCTRPRFKKWATGNSEMDCYCQIRCIALRILQTSEGFWGFLFRQSSEWGQGYANHNKTRSQTASPACDSNETGKRNLRIIHYIKLKNFALLPAATSFCGQRGCEKRVN